MPFVGAKLRVDVAHRFRISSVPGDWVDTIRYPILVDATRARTLLRWQPQFTSERALRSAANALFGSSGE